MSEGMEGMGAMTFLAGMAGTSPEDITKGIDGSQTVSKLEGIHTSVKDVSTSLGNIDQSVGQSGWFHDMLQNLLTTTQTGFNTFSEATKKDDKQKGAEELKKGAKDKADVQGGLDLTNPLMKFAFTQQTDESKKDPSMLKKMPAAFGAGAALLHQDMLILHKHNESEAKKNKSLGDVFKNLLAGAAGIAFLAVALLVFAGALVLFQFVKWGPALAGMVAFAAFSIGMIFIAKLVGKEEKEQKTFSDFAKASIFMALSLGTFAISMLIAGNIFSGKEIKILGMSLGSININGALVALGMFGLFLAGLAIISHLANSENSNFQEFAKASILMSASLVAFSFALLVSSKLYQTQGFTVLGHTFSPIDMGAALKALGTFGLFILGFTVVAAIANNYAGDIKKFTLSTLLMSASLVAFSVALLITSSLFESKDTSVEVDGKKSIIPKINIPNAVAGLLMFIGFIAAFTIVAAIANSFAGEILKFTLVSMLMSVSLIAFSFALTATIMAVTGGQAFGIDFGPKNPLRFLIAIGGLLMMTLFLAAFAGLGIAATYVITFIAVTAVAVLAVSVAMMAFAVAICYTIGAIQGGQFMGQDFGPKTDGRILAAIEGLGLMAGFLLAFAALSVPVAIVSPFTLIASAVMVAVAGAIVPMAKAISLMGLLGSGKGGAVTFDGKKYEVVPFNKKDIDTGFSTVLDFLDVFGDTIGEIGIFASIKLAIAARSIRPVIQTAGMMADVVIKAAKEMRDEQGKPLQVPVGIFDPVLSVVAQLSEIAKTMDVESAVVFALVSASVVPIVQAIDMMIDTSVKAASFGDSYPGGAPALVADAAQKMMPIAEIMFNKDPGVGPIARIIENLGEMSIESAEVFKSLPPIVEAMDAVVDTIIKIGDVDPGVFATATSGLSRVVTFLSDKFLSFIDTLTKKPGGISGFFKGLWGGESEKKSLAEKLEDARGPLGTIKKLIGDDLGAVVKTISEMPQGNMGNMQNLVNGLKMFDTNFTNSAYNFSQGMNYMVGPFKGMTQQNVQIMNGITQNMILLGAAAGGIQRSLAPIIQLSRYSSELNAVAKAVDKIVESVKRLNAENSRTSFVDAISGVGNKVSGFLGKFFGADEVAETKASGGAKSGSDAILKEIATKLDKWDNEGIMIRGLPESEAKAAPVHVYQI